MIVLKNISVADPVKGLVRVIGVRDQIDQVEIMFSGFAFVNNLDKEQADFNATLSGLQEHFGLGVAPVHIPVNPGVGFNQIVDVLKNKLVTYSTDGSGKSEVGEVPAELQDQVASIREQLVEAIAESNDELLEKYLEEGELTDDEISAGLRAGIAGRTVFPVLCGDASRAIGADLFLDFVATDIPSPEDVSPHTATPLGEDDEIELKPDASGPLAAVVFKTISESVGDLSFVRVFSGSLQGGVDAFNASLQTNERVGQAYYLNGSSATRSARL